MDELRRARTRWGELARRRNLTIVQADAHQIVVCLDVADRERFIISTLALRHILDTDIIFEDAERRLRLQRWQAAQT